MSRTAKEVSSASRIERRSFLKQAGGVAAGLLARRVPALAQETPKPTGHTNPKNLIFILADTFRADHLGCYGSTHIKTPNLDQIAAEGVVFTNCYADGLPTIPSRRVYHTGRTIIPMNIYGGWTPLKPGRKTLAQVLAPHGFTTGFVTDTYHYFKPGMNFHRGFSSWQWIRGQGADPWRSGPREKVDPKRHIPSHLWNPEYDWRIRQYLMNTQDRKGEDDYFCARSLRAALKWLARNTGANRFMLWIDTFDPHEPWDAPSRFQEMYYDNYPCKRFLFGYGVRTDDIRPEDLPAIRGAYAAEVSFVDMWIGRFVEGLREMGLLDDTLLVFSSDHGTHLGEEGCVQKTAALLNSCVAQLPLIVRHPGSAFAGKRIHALVSAADYMPTFLEILGIDHGLKVDGKNFWSLATGKSDAIHEYVTTEYASFAAVRDLEWHYFQNVQTKNCLEPSYVHQEADKIKRSDRGVPHLYDLTRDPREQTNVILDHPDIAAKMQKHLKERFTP